MREREREREERERERERGMRVCRNVPENLLEYHVAASQRKKDNFLIKTNRNKKGKTIRQSNYDNMFEEKRNM